MEYFYPDVCVSRDLVCFNQTIKDGKVIFLMDYLTYSLLKSEILVIKLVDTKNCFNKI